MFIMSVTLASHASSLENSDRRRMVCVNCRNDPRIALLPQSIVEQGDGNLGAVALTPNPWDEEKAELRVLFPNHKPAVTDV